MFLWPLFLISLFLQSGSASAVTYVSPSKTLGTGTAHVYVRVDGGVTVEVGVEATASAMTFLTTDSHLHLELPSSGNYDVSPIDHVEFGFAVAGHPGGPGPPNTYWAVPHFDVHFMTITDAAASAIIVSDPTDTSDPVYTAPAASDLPSGYALGPDSGVSGEGSHWANPSEFSDYPAGFDYNFLYGFYNGNMTFQEPMVAQSYLASIVGGTSSAFNESFITSQTNSGFGSRYFTRYNATDDTFQIGILVPEPSSLLMTTLGLLSLGWVRNAATQTSQRRRYRPRGAASV